MRAPKSDIINNKYADTNSIAGFWSVLSVLGIWIAIVWYSDFRYQPPQPLAATENSGRFSAERAESFFKHLYQDADPHPAGSNQAFRQSVIRQFEHLGYSVELHESSSDVANHRWLDSSKPVPLTNIIVRLPGSTDQPPVLFCAHYDSVPSSPGAGDDGSGVTVMLEIARQLKTEKPPKRSIVFLLTDGEEFGLLGAKQFVQEHPLANQIAFVINVEARGTSGPSLMFETSNDSGWIVDLFARTARKPFTSSIFYEIYKFLPNDTDFTVFSDHGVRGMNFAFIGDVRNYHTSSDNFSNVDRGSIQHHGENVLALLRELSQMDIENQPNERAVYFDLFGHGVVRWPASYSLWMSVGATVLILLTGSAMPTTGLFSNNLREGEISSEKSSSMKKLGFEMGLVTVLVGFAMAYVITIGFRQQGVLDLAFPNVPVFVATTYWTIVLMTICSLTLMLQQKLNAKRVWIGVWTLWGLLAIVSSIYATGASFIFVVPTIVAAVCGILVVVSGGSRTGWSIAVIMSAVATGIIWLPMERLFYDAVGFTMNLILAARVALICATLAPLLVVTRRSSLVVLLVLLSLVATLAATVSVLFNS